MSESALGQSSLRPPCPMVSIFEGRFSIRKSARVLRLDAKHLGLRRPRLLELSGLPQTDSPLCGANPHDIPQFSDEFSSSGACRDRWETRC